MKTFQEFISKYIDPSQYNLHETYNLAIITFNMEDYKVPDIETQNVDLTDVVIENTDELMKYSLEELSIIYYKNMFLYKISNNDASIEINIKCVVYTLHLTDVVIRYTDGNILKGIVDSIHTDENKIKPGKLYTKIYIYEGTFIYNTKTYKLRKFYGTKLLSEECTKMITIDNMNKELKGGCNIM